MSDTVRPLTPGLWPDFEALFGKQGACYGCWCTYFRLPPAARRENTGQRNKDLSACASRQGLRRACSPSRRARQWAGCRSVHAPMCRSGTTRAALRRRLGQNDRNDPGVWAISCFFIHCVVTGQGRFASTCGGRHSFCARWRCATAGSLSDGPSKDRHSTGLFVGSTRVFEKASFVCVARRKAGRPLVR